MSLLLNLDTNSTKKLTYVLCGIYGIGLSSAIKLCSSLGYDKNIKMKELKPNDINKINALITIKYKFSTDTERKKYIYDRIKQMTYMKSYKGIRHSYNLPVNGQKTHTNAKTRGWR